MKKIAFVVLGLAFLLLAQSLSAQTYYSNSYFSAKDGEYPETYFPYTKRPVYMNNKTKFIIAHEGDTYAAIAREMNIEEYDLRNYNDVVDWSYEPGIGEVVYLTHKQSKSKTLYHKIEEGETLRGISQKYAINMKSLYKKNVKLGVPLTDMKPGDRICISCK